MIKIEVCPGNLTPGFDRYSPACLRKLFDGKKVSPVLEIAKQVYKVNTAENGLIFFANGEIA